MNEKRFWEGHVKRVMHSPPHYIARKVQDHYNPGFPDVQFCMRGKMGMLELKRINKRPARANSIIPLGVTREQKRQLVEGRNAGGSFWLLASVENNWYLFDPLVMDSLAYGWLIRNHALDVEEADPAIMISGPMKDLAPLRLWLLRWESPYRREGTSEAGGSMTVPSGP